MARRLLGTTKNSTEGGPNSEALPNPWAPRQAAPSSSRAVPITSRPLAPNLDAQRALLMRQQLMDTPMSPVGYSQSAPTQANPMMNFMQQYAMMNTQARQPQVPQAPSEPAEVKYRTELDTLKEMGFTVS